MCGITGFWNPSPSAEADELSAIAKRMSDTLDHRGPDDAGIWVDASAGIGLGHRRLSIVDLSPEGHQPMHSADGRYVIAFNGEIYNFPTLRSQLTQLGHAFRGTSDTEVMLAGFTQWGLMGAIDRFNGMFAFALWDRQERVLHLGRDRLGEKPLYYGWIDRTFLFGSELKALKAFPGFPAQIDRQALTAFLRLSYIPCPYSIYQGIYKLPPGTVLSWPGDSQRPQPTAYWSVKQVAEAGRANPFSGSDAEAIEQLTHILKDAIGMRTIADVPLGAFLSGGIDSSTVVALMQAQSRQPVKTFSIGYDDAAYNEAPYAQAVAQHLGTDHTELYVTPAQAMAVIPKLPALYDEPFSDPSQIPTFLVSQLARQHVTVSLSGDAGDELFGGYNRYFVGRRIWEKIGKLPRALRQLSARAITSVSPADWDRILAIGKKRIPAIASMSGFRLHKAAEILDVSDPDTLYCRLVSHWQQPQEVVIGGDEPLTTLFDRPNWAQLDDFTDRMMYLDSVTYLPDDILVKVDRASMGVSLEGRIPFLDPRIVEWAWRLPLGMKIRNGQGKWLLRQVLYQYVPRSLVDRPKVGFGIPIHTWLRGELRDWAESLLDEGRLRQEGFFHPEPIRQKWAEHLSGDRDWQYYLWDVLMFQAWLGNQLSVNSQPSSVNSHQSTVCGFN
jgi:asparagine synthase (glutamine-hydrolysing)